MKDSARLVLREIAGLHYPGDSDGELGLSSAAASTTTPEVEAASAA